MSVITEQAIPALGERKQLIYKCPRCGLEQILLEVQEHMRELESENERFKRGAWKENTEFRERIAKARKILVNAILTGDKPPTWLKIQGALDALEGK